MHHARNAVENPVDRISTRNHRNRSQRDRTRTDFSCTVYPIRLQPAPILVTAQHAVHQITQRTPVILAAGQFVLIDKQDVVLEAGVQVWLETKVYHDRVVVAVDVGVDSVQTLEDLTEETRECLGEGNAYGCDTN